MPVSPEAPEGADGVDTVIVSRAALEELIAKTRELDEWISDDRAVTQAERVPYVAGIDRLVAALDPEPYSDVPEGFYVTEDLDRGEVLVPIPGWAARRTERLARALKECWLAGEQMNMDLPLGERIDWLRFARAVENRLARAVDTGDG